MVFSHDTEVALNSVVALVNTDDQLASLGELDSFLDEWVFSGTRTRNVAELRAVQELRPRFRAIWTSSRDHAVPLVNLLLADGNARPYLVRHGDWDWHLHATTANQPLHLRIAVEAALGFVDVIRQDEWDRLRLCSAADCDHLMIDLSRNRSRRFCDAGCGNRLNVAAYRARAAGEPVSNARPGPQ